MRPHLIFHVRSNAEIRAWSRRAQQDETCFLVLRVIAHRIARVEFAVSAQFGGACQAAALVADCRKRDSGPLGCVPNVFAISDGDFARLLRQLERHLE